jgi:hypothetical protein
MSSSPQSDNESGTQIIHDEDDFVSESGTIVINKEEPNSGTVIINDENSEEDEPEAYTPIEQLSPPNNLPVQENFAASLNQSTESISSQDKSPETTPVGSPNTITDEKTARIAPSPPTTPPPSHRKNFEKSYSVSRMPVRVGYLFKLNDRGLKNWQRMYFELDSYLLSFYKSSDVR